MCERCDQIDAEIVHLLWMNAATREPEELEAVKAEVQQMKAVKHALHPKD